MPLHVSSSDVGNRAYKKKRMKKASSADDECEVNDQPEVKKSRKLPSSTSSKVNAKDKKNTPKKATPKKSATKKGPKKELKDADKSEVDLNPLITENLNKLGKDERALGNTWPANAFFRAARLVKTLPFVLTSGSQAAEYKGVGDKIAKAIDEILETGSVKKERDESSEEMLSIVEELTSVRGISEEFAMELVTKHNIKSVTSLLSNLDLLNDTAKIGVKYYKDFKQPIPAPEVEAIITAVTKTAQLIDMDLVVTAVGPIRRGVSETDIISILVSHSGKKPTTEFFPGLISALQSSPLVTETLTSASAKFSAVVRLEDIEPKPSDDKLGMTSPEAEGKEASSAPKMMFSIPKASQTEMATPAAVPDLFNKFVRDEPLSENLMKASVVSDEKVLTASGKPHRFLEMRPCRWASYPSELLSLTGPTSFVEALKHAASELGLMLTSARLRHVSTDPVTGKQTPGQLVHVNSEEEIFEHLQMPYVEPADRK